ncbi:MAG: sigma-70 family RNA polymerase sigma factor [Planctomycetota bacterium]|nr:sigma-70 family RNA polymerase sigma factor [Planctomycetota bacterium]
MLDPKTERLTIERARRGDRDAVAELIHAYQRPLEAFLFRMCGKHELAEDLFDDQYRFSTWLFTIGKRLLVNAQQKMKPTADSEVVEYRAGDARTPLAEVESVERGERIANLVEIAIGALGSPQREIVLLFHQQGWSVQRIAAELDMPEGTIKSHLFRARRRMLFAIEQSGAPNPGEVLR